MINTQQAQNLQHTLQAWLEGGGTPVDLIKAFRVFYKDSQLPEKYGTALENVYPE